MQGRNRFTPDEVAQIRRLLQTPNLTPTIRRKLRNLGFYITDWVGVRDGFNVTDFEDLVGRGAIRIDSDMADESQ